MTDLYVSTKGSNSDSGTKNSPFRTIEKAASVAKQGSTVHVAPGRYEGGFTTATDGVTYVSDVKGGAKITSGNGDTAWYNKGDNVTIDGFEVDGSDANWRIGILTTGSGSTIENTKVHDIARDPGNAGDGNGGAGLYADGYSGGTDITVRDNEVFDIGPAGSDSTLIHGIYHGTTGTIAGNVVHDNAGAAIHLWHDAHDIDILGNTVSDSTTGIWVGGGDTYNYSGSADDVKVADNIVHDNRIFGIAEGGDTGTHNRYDDNRVYGNETNWSLQNGLEPHGAAAAAGAALDQAGGVTPPFALTQSNGA